MKGPITLLAVIAIALGFWGMMDEARANQQLNGQQATQFLTSKPNLRSGNQVATWRADGTYTMNRGGGAPFSGTYNIDGSGRVCWRGNSGQTGCFVVFRDAQGYYGRSGNSTWRYQ